MPASQIHGSARQSAAPFRRTGRNAVAQRTYSAVGNSSGRTIVRRTLSIPSSIGEHLGQVHKHSGRRPPDVAVVVWEDEKGPRPLLKDACHSTMVVRVDNKGK